LLQLRLERDALLLRPLLLRLPPLLGLADPPIRLLPLPEQLLFPPAPLLGGLTEELVLQRLHLLRLLDRHRDGGGLRAELRDLLARLLRLLLQPQHLATPRLRIGWRLRQRRRVPLVLGKHPLQPTLRHHVLPELTPRPRHRGVDRGRG